MSVGPTTSSPVVDPSRLQQAVNGLGVTAHYQPVVDLERGTIVGYEALARFSGWSGSPEAWFEAARRHGCEAALEAATLVAGLSARHDLPADTFLSVNLGPAVLAAPEVWSVLDSAGSLAGVVVELTEHVRVDSYADLAPLLDRLRELGALIAIDDAGAGYAGLRHVLAIRPDFVKIDRDLVHGLGRDEARRAMVESLGALAGRLDAWVIAEGVETEEELHTLIDLGIPLAQGYHLARPQAGYGELAPELNALITGRGADLGPDARLLVQSLIERVPLASSSEEATAMLRRPQVDLVVIVDPERRPRTVLAPHRAVQSVRETTLLVNLATPVAEAARRAIARPARTRFDPLVCIDDLGRYVGIVRMERLVDALSRGG